MTEAANILNNVSPRSLVLFDELDLLEHPEKYSETQKDELLGDEEVNELYPESI